MKWDEKRRKEVEQFLLFRGKISRLRRGSTSTHMWIDISNSMKNRLAKGNGVAQ